MIGEVVGNYRVTGKLGEGGMGAVYLAEHTSLGRRVAIKVLLPDASKRPDLVDRFFNEAKTLANLRHPALVEVYDYGVRDNGSAYLVMDYLERRRKLPVAEALDFGRQIAGGLVAAHAQGIVHRDLKPDNVFVVRDPEDPTHERVKILDFGIAKLVQPGGGSKGATQTGMVLGTPLYMAPEQCRGSGTVDHRADVYSLGCILYAMLTGRPPFDYEGVGEILGAHLYEAPKPPRTLDPNIPEALDALVLKALAKKPDERFGSMGEIAQALVNVGARATTGASAGAPVIVPPGAPELARAATIISGGAVPVADPEAAKTPITAADRPGAVAAASTQTTLAGAVGVAALEGGAPVRRKGGVLAGVAVAGALSIGIVAFALHGRGGSARPTVAAAKPPAVPAPVPVPVTAPPPPKPAARAPEPAQDKELRPPERTPAAHVTKPSGGGNANAELYARGLVLQQQGDEAGALTALRAYLGGSGQSRSARADAERRVIALQRRLAEIEIWCDVAGATITVDGVVRGHTPIVSTVVLPPGAHRLELAKNGYQTVWQAFTVAPGEHKPFRFSLPR
jgi:serine/threonine-protein kinase